MFDNPAQPQPGEMLSSCLNLLGHFKDSTFHVSSVTPGQHTVAVKELLPSTPGLAVPCLPGFLSPAIWSSGNK